MEKLSIEQKAERYDEAILSANLILDMTSDKSAIYTIFPELEEKREDERIRKWLLHYFAEVCDNVSEKEKKGVLDWIDKQGEQKPATDNAEQKFKVGDWIVGANNVFKIISLNDKLNCYIAVTPSNKEVKIPYQFDNGQGHMCSYHLWTIQDAKDGDVIFYDKGWTCIFKHIHGIWYSSYCFITNEGEFHTGYEEHAVDAKTNGNVHPATEEQRNLLLEKMREAGYEWDREKKELRKIDWNPQPGDTFRKKGTKSPIYHLCDKLEDGIHFGFVEERENVVAGGEISIFTLKNKYELVERFKPVEKVIEEEFNKITELKPSCSEEDEKIINEIEESLLAYKIIVIDNDRELANYIEKEINWLKSLKDRVQPKK